MDKFDLEASFNKIDSKFTQDLTDQEKRRALKKFRKLYAQQMSKLASEVSKRQKIQENLNSINERQVKDAKEIDDELKKRMDRHNQNREKRQESKIKEYKLMEENWKRRLDEMMRKNRDRERAAEKKAIKMRQQVEEYWNKKSQTVHLKQDHLSQDRKSETAKPEYYSVSKQVNLHQKNAFIRQTYHPGSAPKQKIKFNFPEIKSNQTDLDASRNLNRSIGSSSINDDLKSHQEKCYRGEKEQETQKIQKLMERFEKIQKTRKVAKERMEKQINQAKKIREIRQNPQFLQANRQKSIAQLRKSPLKKSQKSKQNLFKQRSKSKVNLSESIVKHLQSKKRLNEIEFTSREMAFEEKKRKMKETKINRMLKEAINMIKHQTLNETIE